MDRMRVNRVARVGRVAMAAGDAAHTIVSAADDGGGNPVFTTAGPHGLLDANTPFDVVISGTAGGAYDGTQTVTFVGSTTTFLVGTVGFSVNSTGTWRPA